ncbi:MAG TPA: outer membrane beta-barrel protein [Bacteroidales bacterium]|nr:outer membrane beta-barrel protein [Bacteroidales bacterium]HRZ76492.1 outer membrane beta-barrel protein [Bacteroidales bacterium]
MKKILLSALVFLMFFDLSTAQMAFTPPTPPPAGDEGTFVSPNDNDDFAKRRRRKKKGRGRGTEMGLTVAPAIGLGLPMGDFGDGNKMGFGLTVDGLYFMEQLGVGLNTGYHIFGFKEETGFSEGNHSIIPLLPQAVYLLGTSEFKPFVGMGLGAFNSMVKGKLSVTVPVGFNPITGEIEYETVTQDYDDSSTDFGISPVAGFYYTLSDKIHINVNLRYNMIFTKEEVLQEDLSVKEESKTYSYLGANFGVAISL